MYYIVLLFRPIQTSKTSLEGWKQKKQKDQESISITSKTSLEGWKLGFEPCERRVPWPQKLP